MLSLYKHQLDALPRIHNGSILGGDVGSGKSRTALAYYYKKEVGDLDVGNMDAKCKKDLYIITTARKRDDKEWEGDMRPFLLSSNDSDNLRGNHVYVDSWNNIGKYVDVRNAFFIFDEQRVVGKGTWVKSFLKITKFNEWILLSATPGDNWIDYIPVFLANGFYHTRTEFIREHVVYDHYVTKYPKVDHYENEDILIQLRNEILVDMDFNRHTIRHDITIKCDYNKDMYKMILKKRWNPWEEKPIKNITGVCYLLRRVCNSDSSRLFEVLKIVDEKQRVIIFYNFDYELEILKNTNYGKDCSIAEWNGHKHEPIPQTDKWVYLVQYNAGAEGWNCILTDTIIFYSQNYSYKTRQQSAGRIDRLNTPFKDLYYYHFRSDSSIDYAIYKSLKQKQTFNEKRWMK